MTNADRIRSMNDEELAGLMAELDTGTGGVPWQAFHETFCKDCPTEPHYFAGIKRPLPQHPCEIFDSCPHGDFFAWWLRQPAL